MRIKIQWNMNPIRRLSTRRRKPKSAFRQLLTAHSMISQVSVQNTADRPNKEPDITIILQVLTGYSFAQKEFPQQSCTVKRIIPTVFRNEQYKVWPSRTPNTQIFRDRLYKKKKKTPEKTSFQVQIKLISVISCISPRLSCTPTYVNVQLLFKTLAYCKGIHRTSGIKANTTYI